MQLFVKDGAVVAWYADGQPVEAGAHPGATLQIYAGAMSALARLGDLPPGWPAAEDDPRPYAAPVVSVAAIQAQLCADIDDQAEAQRARYITSGSGQAMIYLQKQSQALQAQAAAAATPPMTADQGKAAYILLAAEIGITVDPSTAAPATDVFGVARAVVATVQAWLPLGAAIEAGRLRTKAAIAAATTVAAAQAAHDAAAWPNAA